MGLLVGSVEFLHLHNGPIFDFAGLQKHHADVSLKLKCVWYRVYF